MSIQYDSAVIGEVRAVQVSAAPAVGASLLRFSIGWTLFPKREHVYSILGTYVPVSVTLESSREPRFLGYAIPETAWCDESRDGMPVERQLTYDLLLQGDQLLELEHLRGDTGGLIFKLNMRGNAHGPYGIRQIFESLELRVSVTDWIRLLRDANAGDILLVGVRIPLTAEEPTIASAVQLIRGAYEFLLRGEYDASVGQCRRALESVWAAHELKTAGRSARQALSAAVEERRAMSKRDRQLAIGEAVMNFTHPAHHVGSVGAPEVFSRLDAALAVASAAALVAAFAGQPPVTER